MKRNKGKIRQLKQQNKSISVKEISLIYQQAYMAGVVSINPDLDWTKEEQGKMVVAFNKFMKANTKPSKVVPIKPSIIIPKTGKDV